jgi:putative transposase
VAKPDTILAWYRKLVAHKFDGSKARRGLGRPRVTRKVEQLIVRLAEENRDWGYTDCRGVGQSGISRMPSDGRQCPAAPRSAAGAGAQAHDHLVGVHSHPLGAAGGHRLLHRGSAHSARAHGRRVDIAGITIHPNEPWMKQMARNVTMEGCGILRDCRYTKFTQSFRAIIASGQVEPLALPARSPNLNQLESLVAIDRNRWSPSIGTTGRLQSEPVVAITCCAHLNAYAERWVRSVKEECLFKVVLFGERSLRRALSEYVDHYHEERNHQGKDNVLLFPRNRDLDRERCVQCCERLGGLLRYYHQETA